MFPASFCSASQSIFLKILISFVNQLCHLSRREWMQKSASCLLASNEARFNRGLFVTAIPLTHVQSHGGGGGGEWSRGANQLPSYGPSSQASWLDSSNQMVLLGLSIPALRWQWDGTAFFCLTASNYVFSPMASLCNYQLSRRSRDKPLPCKQKYSL